MFFKMQTRSRHTAMYVKPLNSFPVLRGQILLARKTSFAEIPASLQPYLLPFFLSSSTLQPPPLPNVKLFAASWPVHTLCLHISHPHLEDAHSSCSSHLERPQELSPSPPGVDEMSYHLKVPCTFPSYHLSQMQGPQYFGIPCE